MPTKYRIRVSGAFAALALVLAACSDEPSAPTPILPRTSNGPSLDNAAVENPAVDSIARALALALADPAIRETLRDDLRDSPFSRHAIHLPSYVRGVSGRALARRVAQLMAIPLDSLFALTASLVELEIVLERPIDRLRWVGTADIVVYGSTLPTGQRIRSGTQTAFTTSGGTVQLAVASYDPRPYLALRPAEAAFGSDPELRRRAAGSRSGKTVGNRDQELALLTSCDPNEDPNCCENMDECESSEPAPGQQVGGLTLPAQYTSYYCRGIPDGLPSGSDVDGDDIRDDCEAQLAYAFRPRMAMNSSDDAPQNEPYWSVARNTPTLTNSSTIKIFYAFSYYRDPGDPFFGYTPHDGDSEWVVLELTGNGGSTWILNYATLSAHWGAGGGADHTARYQAGDLEYPAEYRGRPRVWVAWNKHANYRAANVCNNMWNDDCNTFGTTIQLDMWFDWNANLGNSWHPLKDCIQSRNQASNGLLGTECIWLNQNYFAGWHGAHGQDTASPYSSSLNFFGF